MSICSDKYWETWVIGIFFLQIVACFNIKVFTHNLDKNIYPSSEHFPRSETANNYTAEI